MLYADWQSSARIISRPKLSGLGEHWGVQLPNGLVAHHTQTGEEIVTLQEFAQGRPLKEIRRADPALNTQIMWRATATVQNPSQYHLIERNCETYATWLIGETPRSPQAQGAAILALVAALLYFA